MASYAYAAKNGLLTKQTYGNGQYTSFTYDNLGRKKETKTSSGDTYQYKYTGDGQLYSMTDVAGGFAYQYTYDTLGRLMQANRTATGTANHAKNMQAGYTYDTDNRIKKVAYNIPGVDNTFASYYYSSDESSTDVAVGVLTKMSMFSKGWINYTYDAQGRLFKRNIGDLLNESYAYLSKPGDSTNTYTTTWISGKAVSDPNGVSLKYFSYNYNSLGYITTEQETKSGTKLQYTYDDQGQLLTAKKSVNDTLQKTYTYTYDTYGNIRTATDGTTSHTYTYGDSDWADLLTAYDGTALTYDASGNPTSYFNGSSYTMTWRNGRELQNLTKGGKKTSYEYDVDGLRNLKTNADGSYSVYYWLGNLLLAEERHTGNSTRVLVFSYDENNSPIGFQFKTDNGPWYYYLYAKNIQGDIVALYRRDINADGTRSATHIANYEYDPWGKILSIKNAAGQDISNYPDNSANVNPLRYRGYYYDNESGFYYLQSRYYDPTIGRFISADGYISTGQDFIGYNMFAYCVNNPISYVDCAGTDATLVLYATPALEAFAMWLAEIASTNWWNAVGWIAAGILAAGVVTSAAMYLYDQFLEEKGQDLEIEEIELEYSNVPKIETYSEHENNARPSTENKHQKGKRRKQMDAGHEKGDARRKSRSNKRKNKSIGCIWLRSKNTEETE